MAKNDSCGVCGGDDTSCAGPSTATTTSSPLQQTSSPANNSSTLGIAIGVALGGLFLIAIAVVVFVLYRRKQNKTVENNVPMQPVSSAKSTEKAEIPYKELIFKHKIGEGGI